MCKNRFIPRISATLLGALLLSPLTSCGLKNLSNKSGFDTVDLPQTDSKWQSIGNCWVYAVASWIESIALRDTSTVLNISESYVSYRHFEQQLTYSGTTKISTGGSWYQAASLINTYGVMFEGDFIPSEGDKTFSASQKRAVSYLDESLKSGLLKSSRSPEIIRVELDNAFGVVLANVKDKIIPSSNLIIGHAANGASLSLRSALKGWSEIGFDYDYEHAPTAQSDLPKYEPTLNASRTETLKRVKRALNAHEPVIMSWYVDFNALNKKGEFSLENLKAAGTSGRQGWHMVVIEDYVVEGTNPTTGAQFSIGEGEATAEEKAMAAEYGNITYLVIKNSWGGSERLDRSSYIRDGVGGYAKLDASYLFSWIEAHDEETGAYEGPTAIIGDFVIPNRF